MVMRAPLMQAEQHRAVAIQELTPMIMGRSRVRLAEEGLIPGEAGSYVSYANDGPGALHGFDRTLNTCSSWIVFQAPQEFKIQQFSKPRLVDNDSMRSALFQKL